MSGRARDGRLVHFTPTGPAVEQAIRPGDVVTVRATYGAPHHVVADADVLAHRRTRAGDAYDAGTRPTTPRVGLGLPSVGRPEPVVVSAGRVVGNSGS
jgi:tRNA-2-methylthio-N6-dimethylallyladenosine synthase